MADAPLQLATENEDQEYSQTVLARPRGALQVSNLISLAAGLSLDRLARR